MILQKSFLYADLMLKKDYLLLKKNQYFCGNYNFFPGFIAKRKVQKNNIYILLMNRALNVKKDAEWCNQPW